MAKMSNKDLQGILTKHGYKLAKKSPVQDTHPAEAEAATPELEALRAKYLRDDGAVLGEDVATPKSSAHNTDDEIVAVESEGAGGDAWSRGASAKSVVISGAKKKIIGSQG
jgi:hypothetical protein